MTKEVTMILKSHPSNVSRISEALRIATAMIGMDVMPNIVFCCDGVYCLLKEERERSRQEYDNNLRALVDLAGIKVLSNSLEEEGLSLDDLEMSLAARVISLEEASQLIFKSSIVFSL